MRGKPSKTRKSGVPSTNSSCSFGNCAEITGFHFITLLPDPAQTQEATGKPLSPPNIPQLNISSVKRMTLRSVVPGAPSLITGSFQSCTPGYPHTPQAQRPRIARGPQPGGHAGTRLRESALEAGSSRAFTLGLIPLSTPAPESRPWTLDLPLFHLRPSIRPMHHAARDSRLCLVQT